MVLMVVVCSVRGLGRSRLRSTRRLGLQILLQLCERRLCRAQVPRLQSLAQRLKVAFDWVAARSGCSCLRAGNAVSHQLLNGRVCLLGPR